ncbi:hypothetical protein D3C85_922420 [compost metagenome]
MEVGGVTCKAIVCAAVTSKCDTASIGTPSAPEIATVTVTRPGAIPVTRPLSVMVAMALSLVRHWAPLCDVTSCTEPSLIVACAAYCKDRVTGTLPCAGVTCNEATDMLPLPESDDSSSPPHATNSNATDSAHIHMKKRIIIHPINMFTSCPVLRADSIIAVGISGNYQKLSEVHPINQNGTLLVFHIKNGLRGECAPRYR